MADLSAIAAVENPNKVWSRANVALATASPAAQKAFKELKLWLATQKGNPNLRFTALSGASLVTANDGQGVGLGAATIYGVYAQKRVDATASYLKVFDNGTDDNLSGLTAAVVLSLPFKVTSVAAGEKTEGVYLNPRGLAMANGIRAASVTTSDGLTISTAEADAMDGFMISA